MKKRKPVIIFILGPTGVGKSEFAVKLAKKIRGEIISCDSMQVYKGMAIMSQQPSAALRKTMPHHLVGQLEPSQEWSAAAFVEKAGKITEDIIKRKRVPIVAGGTGLYARSFINGLFPSPPRDEGLRRKLYGEAEKKGKKSLYERLLKIDPDSASRIHMNDVRKIVRALEVYELTGRPISEQQREAKGIEDKYRVISFVLDRPRKELYDRIDHRVDKMFDGGIIGEVRRLRGNRMSRTARAILGCKEVAGCLKGEYSPESAKELIKKNTRNYAKRQLTWFRKEKSAKWLMLGGEKRNKALLNTIVSIWKKLS